MMMKRVRQKKVKRRRARGKGKGSTFERWVCKQLSLWVSHGKREDLFWRSAMSGGRATVARSRGKVVRQAGDICAVSPDGHDLTDAWYIECKFYKHVDLEQWIINNNGKIKKWWATCKREARQYGRDPMLVVKQNNWPVLVITKHNHVAHFTAPQIHAMNRDADVSLFEDLMLSRFERGAR